SSLRFGLDVAMDFELPADAPAWLFPLRKREGRADGSTMKWVVRQALANARACAEIESNINDAFLISEQSWLAQAGIRGNKYCAECVKQLEDKRADDATTDLGSLGPPWLAVFWMVMAGVKKQSQNDQCMDAVNSFWDAYIKNNQPAEIALTIRHISFQVPRGEKSKRAEGMVEFKPNVALGTKAGAGLQELMYRALAELSAQRLV
ncbi:unnamed protein product, partial [Prorocentrum cordatum]